MASDLSCSFEFQGVLPVAPTLSNGHRALAMISNEHGLCGRSSLPLFLSMLSSAQDAGASVRAQKESLLSHC